MSGERVFTSVKTDNAEEGSAHSSDLTNRIIQSKSYQNALRESSASHLRNGPPSEWREPHGEFGYHIPQMEIMIEQTGRLPDQTQYLPTSLSHLEIADRIVDTNDFSINEQSAMSIIRGNAGHTIVTLFNEIVRQIREDNKRIEISQTQTDLGENERRILIEAAEPLTNNRSFSLCDAPELTFDIWQKVRDQYSFYRKTPNSKKPLREGSVFKASEVESWWNGPTQNIFEKNLFKLLNNQTKLAAYGSPDMLWLNLPIETDPYYRLSSEELLAANINYQGMFKLQMRARADSLLTAYTPEGRVVTLVVDNKFGKSDELLSKKVYLAQRLLYSKLAITPRFKKIDLEEVTGGRVMFLYRIFDVEAGQAYYADGTIYERDELEMAVKTLVTLSTIKYFYHDDIRNILKEQDEATVFPHLPNKHESQEITQPRLF